jgi:bifunctional UDP-N-acetylglucosamine pyrophosphorylase/glucosamine-1-phosphate N-acetyltransferase
MSSDAAQAQSARSCLTIVLAAGEGSRMKSGLPKVLHKVAGRSMLSHVLAAAGGDSVAAVVGPDREDVAARARMDTPGADVFVQSQRLGTAHAVLAAREAIARGYDDLLVVFADTPLVRSQSLLALRAALADGASVAAMGFEARDPNGYGRLLLRGDSLEAIREQKDANADELSDKACNAGIMALDGRRALELLDSIGSDNAQNEFYLTDAVKAARERGLRCVAVMAPEEDAMGVNDRVQLAAAEAVMQRRLRESAMRAGATMIVGNFVEIKASDLGPGAKVSHLSYIGDASIGADANIGAGTITCNYDGFGKFRTNIGAGAFVGSNTSLVAPVSVGAGAYVGSGSVITQDVPPDSLAVARGRQADKPGWAAAFRAQQKPKNTP